MPKQSKKQSSESNATTPSPSISDKPVPLHSPHASYKSSTVFFAQAPVSHPLHISSISRSASEHVPLLIPLEPQVTIFTADPLSLTV